MDLAIAIIGAAAAVAAAIAALGSWKAARKSNDTAGLMARIEQDRWHQDLTPEFDVTFTARDTADDSADLRVTLKRSPLGRLDEVIITILDEAGKDHWTRGLPDGVTQAEAQMFVWGPWEFNTGASEQVVSNRVSRTRAYSLTTGKNWDLLPLTRTRPGRWMSPTSQDNWRKQYTDQPVRLLITCRRAGHEPWAVPYDAETEPEIEGPYVV